MELKTNDSERTKSRDLSIELLRIFLMVLIVWGHFIGFGFHSKINVDGTPNLSAYLSPLYLYHVDAFVFISGYYGIKLKWEKFSLLIIKMVIYSIIAMGLAKVLLPDFALSLSIFIHNLYPISTCDWWFMAQYLYLMLLAPILNYGMDALNRKQASILVLVLYLSWFRCTYVLLLFIYLLGRYMRKYPIKAWENNAAMVFVISVSFFFLLNLYFVNKGVYIKKLYDYMSPFVVIPAVSIFYVFRRLHITWSGIGVVAPGVLAAYLITTHELPRQAFNDFFFSMVGGNVAALLGVSAIIVVFAALMDNVITRLLTPLFRMVHK